ncbi:MAG: hypothetical protein ACHQ49_13030 [Elusimicrobiota bacterium]
MRAAILAALLISPSASALAQDLGGHEDPSAAATSGVPVDERRATLEEMWQRGILPPDQTSWAPQDLALLLRIRAVEDGAVGYLRRRPGGTRPWTAKSRSGGASKLTKAGYQRYLFLYSQDALAYFESKGADAKWALKLRDWDDKPMFDAEGLITADGMIVYQRAKLNLEAFWKSPNGDAFGTRRPPAKKPANSP